MKAVALALSINLFVALPCDADSTVWVGGWGIWGTTDLTSGEYIRLPMIQAFTREGESSAVLPPRFNILAGRLLHFRDSDGNTGAVPVERVEGPDEVGQCLPEIVVPEPLPVSLENYFLAATAPISVAPSEAISPTDARFIEGIADYLRTLGINAPKIEIRRGLKAALDGDGTMEVVIEAITPDRGIGEMGEQDSGDFSIVAIGSLTGSQYRVADHIGYIYEPDGTPSKFELVALPDFSGSGRFDVAVGYAGWEWAGIDIYEWTDGSVRLLASAYCGL